MTPKEFYAKKYDYQNIDAMIHTTIPLTDIYKLMQEYHESQLKLLDLHNVSKSWRFCPTCGTEWTNDCEQFGCWQCGESRV